MEFLEGWKILRLPHPMQKNQSTFFLKYQDMFEEENIRQF
jgi:hypothetical protein